MKENYFLGVYWGARKENIDECVDKICKTLNYLKQMDESFALWYDTDKLRKGKIPQPINLERDGIHSLLIRGQIFNDDYKLEKQLGFQIYLKSASNFTKSHILSITCSSYDKVTNSIPNNVNITIKGANLSDKSDINDIESIYNFLNLLWRPERGVMKVDE